MVENLKETPLTQLHRSAGAKMAPFAGYEMPVQYAGVLKEHDAVRNRAGIFDVSHMGHCLIEDPSVSWHLSRPLESAAVGKSCYTLILNERGGIIDDCIFYRLAESRWHLITNAARKEVDFTTLSKVTPRTDLAMIALQGPNAISLAGEICPRRSFATNVTAFGVPVELVARTGYTGEDGYEFVVKSDLACEIWEKLRAAGTEPCGLAARDLLRIEAGLPLYGTDMSEATTPFETGLDFAVRKDDSDYIARKALRDAAPSRRRAGIRLPKGAIPRTGHTVLDAVGKPIGVVTSGTYTPILDCGIALTMIERSHTIAAVEIRGRACPAEEVPLPFYRKKK